MPEITIRYARDNDKICTCHVQTMWATKYPPNIRLNVAHLIDSLRLMPVSRAQKKRRTKIRIGVAVLEPGSRRKDEPHTQELGL